jgi:hypothetical protein
MSDIEPRLPLGSLDPATGDPGYWERFHDRVMKAVAPELARRRALPLTVSGLLLSWSRLLVPGAAAAAVVAGLLLMPPVDAEEAGFLFAVEDILRQEAVMADLAPVFLASEAATEDLFIVSVERSSAGEQPGTRP